MVQLMHKWSGATGCLFDAKCKCQRRIDDLRIHITPRCLWADVNHTGECKSFDYALLCGALGILSISFRNIGGEDTTCLMKKAVRAAGCICCAVRKVATRDDHSHLPSAPSGVKALWMFEVPVAR